MPYPARRDSLDAISSRLVHRLAGANVAGNLFVGKLAEVHLGDLRLGPLESRGDDANTGDHLVRAAGQQAQHARRIVRVDRLLQQMLIDHDDRIGAKNHIVGMTSEDRERLVARQPLRVGQRRLPAAEAPRGHAPDRR